MEVYIFVLYYTSHYMQIMNILKQSKGRLRFYVALVVSSALIALMVLTDTPLDIPTFWLILFALCITAKRYNE